MAIRTEIPCGKAPIDVQLRAALNEVVKGDDVASAMLDLVEDTEERACSARAAAMACAAAHDGAELSRAYVDVASSIGEIGVSDLGALPKTTVAEAMKDPDAARGSVVRTTGTIVQIRKTEQTVFQGTMSTGSGFVYFVVRGDTAGVVDGSFATLVGLFLQRYSYPNLAGGTTESAVVIGMFDLLANRKTGHQIEYEADLAKAKKTAGAVAGHAPAAASPPHASAAAQPVATNQLELEVQNPPPILAPTSSPSHGCDCAAGDIMCAARCSHGK